MRKIFLLITAFILFTASTVLAQYRVGYLQKGRMELWNENYENAIEFFNAAIKNHPKDYKAYYFRGFAKYYLDDFYGAIKDLSTAIDILPEHPDYYLLRGVIYSEQLNYSKALKDMNTALKLDSNFIDVYYYRALIFLDLREFDKAAHDCEKVMKSDKKFENLDLINGVLLTNTGKLDEAVAVFNDILKYDSTNARAMIQLGLVNIKKEAYNKAIENFNYIIDRDTLNTYAIFQRAQAYMKLEQFDAALNDLDFVLAHNPNNQLAYFNRAIVQSHTEQNDDALNDYFEILRKNPDNLLVYYNLGINFSRMKDYENAIKSFTKVIELYPDYFNAYQQRAIARQRMGDMAGYMDDVANYEEIKKKAEQKSDTVKYEEGLKLLELTHLSGDFAKEEIKDKRPQYKEIDIELRPFYTILLQPDKKDKWYIYDCKENCPIDFVTLVSAQLETITEPENPADINYTGNPKYIEYHQDISTLIKLGFVEKALEIVDSLLPLYPNDLFLNFSKANLTLHLLEKQQANQKTYTYDYGSWLNQQYTEVMNIYNSITENYPDFYFAYYNRAYAWFLIEDYDAAIADYYKVVLLNENGPAYYNLGLLSLIINKKEQACNALSKAGELGVIEAYRVIKEYCN